MTDLSERLAEAKGNASIDAVVERAHRAGHQIDRATVARYVAGGGAKRPPERVLQALAAGLDVDLGELRELAGMPRGELGPWRPPAESGRLRQDQRDALDLLIKSMTRQERDGDDAAPTNRAPLTAVPAIGEDEDMPPPADMAAYDVEPERPYDSQLPEHDDDEGR